jgi:hypothetical protein
VAARYHVFLDSDELSEGPIKLLVVDALLI